MKKVRLLFVLIALSLSAQAVFAVEKEISPPTKTQGFYLSGLGDTAFDIVSLNAAWNFDPKWRATLSFSLGLGLGLAAGVKYLFLEEAAFRPYLGLSAGVVETKFFDAFNGLFSPGYVPQTYSLFLLGVPFGVEWVHSSGFYAALGGSVVDILFDNDPSLVSPHVFVMPHLNLGWFF